MSEHEMPELPDIGAMRAATATIAEMIWTYHAALVASGFTEEQAFMLTVAYQTTAVESLFRGIG